MAKQNIDFLRTNSAPTVPAQITKVLQQPSNTETAVNVCLNLINKSFYFQGLAGAVATILFQYGLRISEILNVRWCDVSATGLIYIKGLKGSDSMYIQAHSHLYEWQSFRNSGRKVKDYYSRFYFYRHFKHIGISFQFGGNKRQSVTHAPRHFRILAMQDLNPDTDAIKSTIGHKHSKSTTHYFGRPCYINSDGIIKAKNNVTHHSPRTVINQGIRSPLTKNQLQRISGYLRKSPTSDDGSSNIKEPEIND